MELTEKEWQRIRRAIVIRDGKKENKDTFFFDTRPVFYAVRDILKERIKNGIRP